MAVGFCLILEVSGTSKVRGQEGERLKAGSSPHSLALISSSHLSPPSELLCLVSFIHSCLSVPIILCICCFSNGQHACFHCQLLCVDVELDCVLMLLR